MLKFPRRKEAPNLFVFMEYFSSIVLRSKVYLLQENNGAQFDLWSTCRLNMGLGEPDLLYRSPFNEE